ncbi:zinc-dependent peptidase [Kerstersia gyiorum]|uniref:M90 family metallopeptidase n=1 Tax=Kerstersia gyiorum TaxID=206506 RepID=UPI00209DB482|nr:M90 family metallopeptidase [Kerstersia gyiorum]MCP1632468.1 Mlc titration factor MtfA (ptsG expression regulator) [Kerstersia gyiorum]MCP1635025.1 Mlc titration factor MtfA (ptsG expression regulator) [Kerstersia gyiorum]MCP1670048.1 Mlc titration factor MtfA (ptsG expression regulator) [Kerstersia gyiorum]MCP1678189.1 Mlc titration factor MtfA (ptsG expression regulator) [Kerstersia gyiorum]MCP1680810.1 Mlc titration factor MtfA (ptsG expression regulator) [Kerstersia gyiorum]
MFRWLTGSGASRSATERMQARIPADLWEATLRAAPYLAALDDTERTLLLQRTAWLLASKTINGAQGMVIDNRIRLTIAAQACLPILHLPVELYAGWDEIIVYPSGFLIPRQDADVFGVVHEYMEEAAGQAWDGGPVLLSWDDTVDPGSPGFNVVIHEFAHKLDLYAGDADGTPLLEGHAGLAPRRWRQILDEALETLRCQLEDIEATLPPDVDPDSPEAGPWYEDLPLDPYAATDEAEFFAVSSEVFFVDPLRLAQAMPAWYEQLSRYYRQDPRNRSITAAQP